jgi:asparagine synthase (glutamine-hydrolysing)
MCGIVGILSDSYKGVEDIRLLTKTLQHRGPDGIGIFEERKPYLAFGHTRLSIIDLSSNGSQPKVSLTGRYTVTFNGEIYNHLKLRREIESNSRVRPVWAGGSDTETLLMCFECFGIIKTLEKITGMFAIAVWDKKNKEVTIARDRFGEKPLYYFKSDKTFVFASELRAIKKHNLFQGGLSNEALSYYFRYNYIPAPYSIYENIFKLNSGCLINIKYRKGAWQVSDLKEVEWTPPFHIDKSLSKKIVNIGEHKTINMLDDVLTRAVDECCISDVPVGSFLSGGIDSTLISAIMQKVSNKPIDTFTIGSKNSVYDESKYASRVSKYLGASHHELIVDSNDAINIIPDLCNIYDEPFADSSQIPMVLLSKFVKPHVSVSLSGDGGDEVFGGYNRYVWGESVYNIIDKVPNIFRGPFGSVLNYLSQEKFQNYINASFSVLPKNMRVSLPSDKLRKISKIMHSKSHVEMYKALTQASEASLILKNDQYINIKNYSKYWNDGNSSVESMMFTDRKTYLVDDILVKTDRATMSVGLENRSPFLNNEVFTFADSLSDNYKIRNKKGKWILKELLGRYIPNSYTDRPKAGFSIPIGDWLRGPLKEWASSLISKEIIDKYNYLDYEAVNEIWVMHLLGKEMHNELWGILMLQSWLEAQDV